MRRWQIYIMLVKGGHYVGDWLKGRNGSIFVLRILVRVLRVPRIGYVRAG